MRWIVLGFCSALAAATGASAQQAPRPHQAVNADLIKLHDDLRLSQAQEAAWRNYAIAVAPNPDTEARHRAATDLMPMVPTPRRIALIEAIMTRDAADFHKQAAAVNAFYGMLTAQQQHVFDQETLALGTTAQR
jgi:hypothetical protein